MPHEIEVYFWCMLAASMYAFWAYVKDNDDKDGD